MNGTSEISTEEYRDLIISKTKLAIIENRVRDRGDVFLGEFLRDILQVPRVTENENNT